jgi:hypothetical protein
MNDIENVYFDAGGFYSAIENIGCMDEMIKQSFRPKKIYGCSSGAIGGLVYWLTLNGYVSLDIAKCALFDVVGKQPLLLLDIMHVIVEFVDCIVPYWPKNLASLITDKVYMGVSSNSKSGGFKWISHYDTNADIYRTLLMTTNAPGVSSYSPRMPTEFCLDGFLSFKQEYLPDNTMILRRPVSTWVSITSPPMFTWPALIEFGRRRVVERNSKDKLAVSTNAFRRFALFLHENKKYDDRWNKHIEQLFDDTTTRKSVYKSTSPKTRY